MGILWRINKKIFEFINDCYEKNMKSGVLLRAKGLDQNIEDPYLSSDLGILKFSVPDFIINNTELMKKIKSINLDESTSRSKGNFNIFLKKK